MALVFGGLALATAAVCAILLLMQRNEQRKLITAVQARDEQIGRLESARTEGQAVVQEYAAREAQARKDLDETRRGSETRSREWAAERGQLEQQMQSLRDELTKSGEREQQATDRAKSALEVSEVPTLKLRASNGAWINANASLKAVPAVKVYRPLRGILDAELSKAVVEAMLARVKTDPDKFDAYIDARAVVRTQQVTPREVHAVAIVVQLVMPLVDLELDEVAWVPVVTEFDEVVSADAGAIETMFHDRVKLLTERVLERAMNGGPPGQPASQLLPSQAGTPPAGAAPPPAGGGRAPKPGGP